MHIFTHSYRVTYGDCTVGNHVYYGRYLELLEAGRGEFFRHLGTPFLEWQQQGYLFPVIECHLRYKAAARYDDLLAIQVWVTLARGVRLNFAGRVLNQRETLVLEAETCHACTDLDSTPRRLPPALVRSLGPYLAGGAA